MVKKTIFAFLLSVMVSLSCYSQNIRLIPSTRHVPQTETPVPNYGQILKSALDAINLAIATKCHRKLKYQLDDLIWERRRELELEKDFQVIIDYTDCKVMIFPCAPCDGSVISKPNKKIHSYIIKLIPIIYDEDGNSF